MIIMSDEKKQEIVATDENGKAILIESILNKRSFVIGIVLGLFCVAVSILFLTSNREYGTDFLDWVILGIAIIVTAVCIREVLLNQKRYLALTEDRIYGHTGHVPLDIKYKEITVADVKSRNNFLYGTIMYLFIRTMDGKEYKIEQIKNIEEIGRVLDSKLNNMYNQ